MLSISDSTTVLLSKSVFLLKMGSFFVSCGHRLKPPHIIKYETKSLKICNVNVVWGTPRSHRRLPPPVKSVAYPYLWAQVEVGLGDDRIWISYMDAEATLGRQNRHPRGNVPDAPSSSDVQDESHKQTSVGNWASARVCVHACVCACMRVCVVRMRKRVIAITGMFLIHQQGLFSGFRCQIKYLVIVFQWRRLTESNTVMVKNERT